MMTTKCPLITILPKIQQAWTNHFMKLANNGSANICTVASGSLMVCYKCSFSVIKSVAFMEVVAEGHVAPPALIILPNHSRRSLEEWVSDELHLTFRRFCLWMVAIETVRTIANILFQTAVGWWHTWSFSADYENPDIFYPILLMPIRAISWLDVTFSLLFLLTCCMALCGLLKDVKALLKPVISSVIPFLLWRLLCIIFYICVAALQKTELFTLYGSRSSLITYILVWILVWPMDILLFICLRRQYRYYKQGVGHPFSEIIHEL